MKIQRVDNYLITHFRSTLALSFTLGMRARNWEGGGRQDGLQAHITPVLNNIRHEWAGAKVFLQLERTLYLRMIEVLLKGSWCKGRSRMKGDPFPLLVD